MMVQKINYLFLIVILTIGCSKPLKLDPYIIILGIAQDGGIPHAGCNKVCCASRWNDPSKKILVSSLGIVDPETNETWMIDATPDFTEQFEILTKNSLNTFKGILLTHAHIGHYTGLIHLGREVMGTKSVPVYTMPKMKNYLEFNGPWSQLVKLKNIELKMLSDGSTINLNHRIKVTPFLVPHRDEFSETVGYKIEGPKKSIIFIPDIDKWSKWDKDIVKIVDENDFAFLDGSFFQNGEIPGRDMSEIPHPFIIESLDKLKSTKKTSKVHFIHLNHTNPALIKDSNAHQQVINAGFNIAQPKQVIAF